MINLAVINLKKLIKSIIKIIIVTLVVAMIFSFIKILKKIDIKKENKEDKIIQTSSSIFEETKEETKDKILSSEMGLFYNEDNDEEYFENSEMNIAVKLEETIQINKEASSNSDELRNLKTQVMAENNRKDVYTNSYQTVQIKNESDYNLTPEMLNPNINFTDIKDIIIYHTHTCESYTPTESNNYASTGNFRTTDLNYSVASVGTELTNCLVAKGYNVKHNLTYHDYPAYNGSYTRSLATIKNEINNLPNTQLIIDLHRDALGSNSSYGPTVKIGEEKVAQLMFVMGTNGGRT